MNRDANPTNHHHKTHSKQHSQPNTPSQESSPDIHTPAATLSPSPTKPHNSSPSIAKPHTSGNNNNHPPNAVGETSSENKEEKSQQSSTEEKAPPDVRIAVIGNVDSGKSTMIGVLTSGEHDDGRGSARARILRHNHEQANGRTSCSSQHILGFNGKKKPIHQPVASSATPKQKTQAWGSVFRSSANIVTFIDLAGHEKYLKTTISGLTGCFPDYALIVVGANMGISKMSREHIQVAIALSIPLFVVITKIDISPEKILKHTVKVLVKLLRSNDCNNKMPMIIRKKKEIKLLFDKDVYLQRICPIFCVSAVKGDNLDKLNYFLSQLRPRAPWKHRKEEQYITPEQKLQSIAESSDPTSPSNGSNPSTTNNNTAPDMLLDMNKIEDDVPFDLEGYGELEIDETFAVRGVGIVVSGTVTAGRIYPNQKLFLGPFTDSTFKEIIVRSVHIKRCSVEYGAIAGQSCSVSFRFLKRKEVVDRIMIRKGMVAVSHEANKPKPVWGFTAAILVLHHPTTINEGYQPVVHCGNIRQTATICKMSKHRLRSGDKALVDLKFLCNAEYLHCQRPIIIREGSTKCIGRVIALYPTYNPGLSDFAVLSKKYLSACQFDIGDDQMMAQSKLLELEEEMKALKIRQKEQRKAKREKGKEDAARQKEDAEDRNENEE